MEMWYWRLFIHYTKIEIASKRFSEMVDHLHKFSTSVVHELQLEAINISYMLVADFLIDITGRDSIRHFQKTFLGEVNQQRTMPLNP